MNRLKTSILPKYVMSNSGYYTCFCAKEVSDIALGIEAFVEALKTCCFYEMLHFALLVQHDNVF
ncbi:MAG: hypothetical protein AAF934_04540, partial [Bacteroidota bacterium]